MNAYLVLHVRPYDFESDDNRRIQGATVTYIDPETPVTNGERGKPPLSLSVDQGVDRQLKEVPGFYELEFAHKRGKNGRPQVVLSGARLVSSVAFTPGSKSGSQTPV